jgi:hypothetical protein
MYWTVSLPCPKQHTRNAKFTVKKEGLPTIVDVLDRTVLENKKVLKACCKININSHGCT